MAPPAWLAPAPAEQVRERELERREHADEHHRAGDVARDRKQDGDDVEPRRPEVEHRVAMTGLCGALTTYSTFGYETILLLSERARTYAVLNAVASVVAGLGAAFCGVAVAQAL